ncbi:hypothetical protein CRG98_047976 [Punica granatum]|uniref:Cation/H+ exchanger domain-containing protein n=1 Tax=Punica granatum TaxID=22663 RepID=A0A2I0HJ48_PUNGR|nr:hypothetical protein CRG98_047976 [Punica granatum]
MPVLCSILFGEGVANDAMSIVLFNAVQSIDVSNINGLIALKLLGIFLYLFSLVLLLESLHSTDREVALMMLLAYLSYMLAEAHS